MKFSPENLKEREKFLTPELFKTLSRRTMQTENDYFTATDRLSEGVSRRRAASVSSRTKTEFEVVAVSGRDDNAKRAESED